MHVPVQTSEMSLPALEKPALQAHVVEPDALVLPAGHAVHVVEPDTALYVLLAHTTCSHGPANAEDGAVRQNAAGGTPSPAGNCAPAQARDRPDPLPE